MRIWTLHPRYLDSKGLVAVWRETLLAQAVLAGRTKGYRNHPQLTRFRESDDPLNSVRLYLQQVLMEAARRGYSFDPTRIDAYQDLPQPPVIEASERLVATRGQLDYEWRLLRHKLALRSPDTLRTLDQVSGPKAHPLFRLVKGPVEAWEKPKELDSGSPRV